MRALKAIGFVVALLFGALPSVALPAPCGDLYERHTFVDSLNVVLPYRLLTPKATKGELFPLVVFLHGSGERGTDNERQLTHGASLFAAPETSARFPAYVLFPQCEARAWTLHTAPDSFRQGAPLPPLSPREGAVMQLIATLLRTYPIDSSRVYLMGISMGAIATYDLACRFPTTFAAAVPICGAVNPDFLPLASRVPFMIFHGENDSTIPVEASRDAFSALTAAGASAEYIEFPGEGHDCWDSAFGYPDLLPWLFSQRKPTS